VNPGRDITVEPTFSHAARLPEARSPVTGVDSRVGVPDNQDEAGVDALAGACPLNADGVTVAPGSYLEQTQVAFDNLLTALAHAGAGITDVLSTRLLVASSRQEDLWEAWAVYREAMGAHDAPSTLIGVTVLGYPDQLVEIEAMAAVVD
jgi:enamine deaminase RidA (YjgF/YER057c/UK114 family)